MHRILFRSLETPLWSTRGHVQVLAFDSKRYVGAQIGIYNPSGAKVGKVSHLRNLEDVVVAGERKLVERVCSPVRSMGQESREAQLLPGMQVTTIQ